MSYHLNLNQLLKDLNSPGRTKALSTEIHKIKTEIEKLTRNMKPQAQAQAKKLETRYKLLQKTLHEAQSELDKEVKKTLVLLKKTKNEAERNLGLYKKLAKKQKTKFTRALQGKTTKKTASRSKAV